MCSFVTVDGACRTLGGKRSNFMISEGKYRRGCPAWHGRWLCNIIVLFVALRPLLFLVGLPDVVVETAYPSSWTDAMRLLSMTVSCPPPFFSFWCVPGIK